MRSRLLLLTLSASVALAALTGCDSQAPTIEAIEDAQGPEGEAIEPGTEGARKCLEVIWQARQRDGDFGGDEERDFDLANDAARGGSIGCATGSGASQFAATIGALRQAANDSDRAALLAEAGIPLLFIDDKGELLELETAEALEAAFDDVFPEHMLVRLRGLALDDMSVVPGRGGFFDLGALWLVVPEVGARPQLVTVNGQAAAEAAAVAASEQGEASE